MTVTPISRLSLEQFLELPDRARYELVDGELVELAETIPHHGYVAAKVVARLLAYAEPRRLGVALGESALFRVRLPEGHEVIRRADGSFIPTDDPSSVFGQMVIDGAPPLVVEVVSKHDRYTEVMDKAAVWLDNGAHIVWVLDHEARAFVHRAGMETEHRGSNDRLSGEDVLPGFECVIRDLYGPTA